ncbi:hypothetical protein RHMOL_Rhmol09G0183800 [Rhododendron molle]|uniref:Uncharacterized protein n=2 Tax=Rhododendron molle TaxID=49168 RepID=A0ACC0MFS7_RHOML|nr:hypothetical protein RHMOL_Rhmol09G0183800 [Rhododendron molle]KAI8539450.1 hypothetical protein RHMOL_Rhmol09G0183800 [Rhododendron molle]
MSAHGLLFSIFLLLFFGLNVVTYSLANAGVVPEKGTAEMKPAAAETRVMMVDVNEISSSRRGLGGSFQICALCTCCGGAQGYCLPSPCCYAINCNIPHRPFGFCAFTPKTCNCFGCSNL